MKVLVTCPPMLGMIESFIPIFNRYGIDVTAPKILQIMTEEELIKLLPQHDAWIIGDDPATRRVFTAGKAGKLKAAVKWGIGTDNVDFTACKDLDIPISNTPNMFGSEVADIAVGYVIALARQTFQIDREVRDGKWPKPRGISLSGKTAALIGLGDIGINTAKRLIVAGMDIIAYDPFASTPVELTEIQRYEWPLRIEQADFIIATCALTSSSYHMLNSEVFAKVKNGVRIVNVSRGPIIDEFALESALKSGKVYSAALDVFEQEPLRMDSYLRTHSTCILGSHNASNTFDAVLRTSTIAINKLIEYLKI
jgi:D-3-phosphoglycerate dehydrogenase / 2-oxoglutarate reductase